MSRKTKYVGRSNPQKGSKPGIYGAKKDITPTPKTVPLQINLPIPYVNALMEQYPDLTLYKAVKTHLMSTLSPIESKDIK